MGLLDCNLRDFFAVVGGVWTLAYRIEALLNQILTCVTISFFYHITDHVWRCILTEKGRCTVCTPQLNKWLIVIMKSYSFRKHASSLLLAWKTLWDIEELKAWGVSTVKSQSEPHWSLDLLWATVGTGHLMSTLSATTDKRLLFHVTCTAQHARVSKVDYALFMFSCLRAHVNFEELYVVVIRSTGEVFQWAEEKILMTFSWKDLPSPGTILPLSKAPISV